MLAAQGKAIDEGGARIDEKEQSAQAGTAFRRNREIIKESVTMARTIFLQ